MNNRDYKQFTPESYFHIFNRGNGKRKLFFDDEDFNFFSLRLREGLFPSFLRANQNNQPTRYHRQILRENSFSLLAYCLMPNHFHLVIRQNLDTSIAILIKKVCTSYAKYFNKKYERVGGLFEHKFRAVRIEDDSYLTWLTAYVHQNPKVSGLVDQLSDWPYSSYLAYIENQSDSICNTNIVLGHFLNARDYTDFVEKSYDQIKQRKDLEHLLIEK
jgi:putative transposase